MKRLVLAAAALAGLCVAVQAQPAEPQTAPAQSTLAQSAPSAPAPSQSVCLQIGQVYDFKTVSGNRSLIVVDRLRKKYKLNFMGVCQDLQFNLGLSFKSHGTGRLSCIAKGDYVVAPDPAIPFNQCPIQSVEAYTPAMEQADALAAQAAKAK